MEPEQDVEQKTNCSSSERELDRDKDNFVNKDQKSKERAQNHRLVLSTACFGFICIFLLAAIVVLHIKLMADKDIEVTQMLQSNSRCQTEKDQLHNNFNSLSEKNQELKKRVNDPTFEISQLERNFDSLNQKNQELEKRVNQLSSEKSQLQGSFDSLNQTKLELEKRVNNLTSEKSQLQRSFDSLSQKNLELETELKKLFEKELLFWSSEAMNWSDSRQYCRDRGADLVIIKSEDKQRFISSFVKETVWIGLSDIDNEGEMKWVDDSSLNQGFWSERQPNNSGGDEDCVDLIPSNAVLKNWNDAPCSLKKRGICEK